ncbi:MAG: FKBP-type peptidyl-prolyl cis-trans isomerase, partial [Candidatus Aminicenantes bacterium]|nr:FKBP-type peptidyl-prolyl cis-trans isomerase [Candidatus Aminicenantes bacterium]
SDRSYLDNNYTVFGHVIEGIEVVHSIVQDDVIDSMVIVRIGKKAKQFKSDTASFQKLVTEAKEKLREEEDAKIKREADIIQTNWPQATSTESGLKYVVVQEGQGQKPEIGAILKVLYSGKTLEGNLPFTSSDDGRLTPLPDAAPFNFILGESRINPGINEALADMKKGEKRILILKSDLAFGTSGFYAQEVQGQKRFVISPNTTLVYEIEVLDIIQ